MRLPVLDTYSLALTLAIGLCVLPTLALSDNTFAQISPQIANCTPQNPFVVSVQNPAESTGGIFEVRLQKSASADLFACGPAPTGWEVLGDGSSGVCVYSTSTEGTSMIAPGQSQSFSFNATLNSNACVADFLVSSRISGEAPTEMQASLPVSVDCQKPFIKNLMGKPNLKIDPNCNPQTATCNFFAGTLASTQVWGIEEKTCDAGLDRCNFSVSLNGVPQNSWNVPANNNQFYPGQAYDIILFREEGSADVSVECIDKAGNSSSIFQNIKVDGTGATAEKSFVGENYSDGNANWIGGNAKTVLSPVDPDPTGFSCNAGSHSTWWQASLENGNEACLAQENCLPKAEPPQYFGMCLWNQNDWCNERYPGEQLPQCLEENAKRNCNLGEDWNIYTEPIGFLDEGCYNLSFFGEDKLGNAGSSSATCFFVDKTLPLATLQIGDPNSECDENQPACLSPFDGNSFADHIVTASTPLTISCSDQGQNPSGNNLVHWRHTTGSDETWLDWQSATPPQTFSFGGEGFFRLEFYCTDKVLNESVVQKKFFKIQNEVASAQPQAENTGGGTGGQTFLFGEGCAATEFDMDADCITKSADCNDLDNTIGQCTGGLVCREVDGKSQCAEPVDDAPVKEEENFLQEFLFCEEITCNDRNPCTSDVCNEENDKCMFSNIPDNTACPNGICINGKCVPPQQTQAPQVNSPTGFFGLGEPISNAFLYLLLGIGLFSMYSGWKRIKQSKIVVEKTETEKWPKTNQEIPKEEILKENE